MRGRQTCHVLHLRAQLELAFDPQQPVDHLVGRALELAERLGDLRQRGAGTL
jgi:hypothetical protein